MNTKSQALPYGLPARPTITLGTYYPVPYMTLTEFQYAIRQLLSSFESITLFEWVPDESSYIIEYGSRPIEEIATCDEELSIVYHKKAVAKIAANEASKRFPHNTEFGIVPILQYQQQCMWSQSKLSVFWDEHNNRLCFETLRFKGNKRSSAGVGSLIIKYFDKLWQIQIGLKCALVEAGVDIESTHLRDYLVCDLV